MTRDRFIIGLLMFLLLVPVLKAGQTGKISGYVKDQETGEAVIGANVMIQGTYLGSAADIEGYYYINNVPPGTYVVTISAVGYRKTVVKDVIVRIDLTTNIDVSLYPESIQLDQEVVVTAEKPLITKDLTSTKASVSASEIAMLPVDNINQVINLQAGVVDGHFRGGRSNEVAYLVDGVPVTDAYNASNAIDIDNSSVRELEVISGTFNAEYGQALSGVVNIVTREGGRNFESNVSYFLGSYYSNDNIYRDIDKIKPFSLQDVTFAISGPTYILPELTFFATGRYLKDDGPFYGKRIYNTNDRFWIFPTGDGAAVAMNTQRRFSSNAKLTYSIPDWKFNYAVFFTDAKNRYYDHYSSWTPDAPLTHFSNDLIHSFQVAFYPSQSTFSSLKLASNMYKYYGYLYADEYDPRYVDPNAGVPTSGYTFRQGGNAADRYSRTTLTSIIQWAIEAQVSKEHKVKLGVEGQYHDMYSYGKSIVNLKEGQVDDNEIPLFELGYRNFGTPGNQGYRRFPFQFAGFIQDKMEYDIMIINAGLRFDYFNPNTEMPADLRNPSRNNPNPNFPGAGLSTKVNAKYQVSPRIGVSFPISDQGAIYFSYGHFFQIPGYENLYRNAEYLINQGQSLSSITGNPDLDAQKTIKYELGLQQVVFPNVSLDVTAYYSDIRNLLGMEILSTYEGFKYARFINRDYGNVKGLILTLDKRFTDYFSAKIDYTYQFAEGNASDPYAVYNDNQSDPPVESEKRVVPLDWDQRSTINFTGSVGVPGDWTVGFVMQYGTGMPFTEDIRISNGVRFENGGRKPTTFNFDLKADKFFDVYGTKIYAFLLVYNVFGIMNEYGVYSTTGRANSDLNTKFAGEINGFNTLEEYVNNPQMYSYPRQIRVGFSFGI